LTTIGYYVKIWAMLTHKKNNESVVQKEWASRQPQIKARRDVTISDGIESRCLPTTSAWQLGLKLV